MKTLKREPPFDLSAVKQAPTLRRECTRPEFAIVLGGADCVFDDVHALLSMSPREWPGLYIAANDVGCHWPVLDHWASFHVDKLVRWKEERAARGLPPAYGTWGWRPGQPVDFVLYPWSGGSSGMLAAQVAIVLGCRRVVLCGMPMTPTAHFNQSAEFSSATTVWAEADGHWKSWVRVYQQGWFGGHVRSMSGRTRELLGTPDVDWFLS
jgi:hypothetical protein